MSLIDFATEACSHCGTEDIFLESPSIYSYGSMDLDTRPPPDGRTEIISASVKRCENCTYCNTRISIQVDGLQEILDSRVYKEYYNDATLSRQVVNLLCKSIILEAKHSYKEAAWASIMAAWSCDDAKRPEKAKSYRKRALELFQLENATSALSYDKLGERTALIIDLYKRIENFEYAGKLCDARLQVERDMDIRKILFFQKHLSSIQDVGAHNLEAVDKYYNEVVLNSHQNKLKFNDLP